MPLKGWNLNLKPKEVKKRAPAFYGVLKPKADEQTNWDNSADRWIGKIVSASQVYPDQDWQDWMVISLWGEPSNSDTELSVMDTSFVHKDYLVEIPPCICDSKHLASYGCTCGCMAAEKMFHKLIKLAQK